MIQAWGRAGAHAYLLEQRRGKFDFAKTCDEIVSMRSRHPGAQHAMTQCLPILMRGTGSYWDGISSGSALRGEASIFHSGSDDDWNRPDHSDDLDGGSRRW